MTVPFVFLILLPLVAGNNVMKRSLVHKLVTVCMFLLRINSDISLDFTCLPYLSVTYRCFFFSFFFFFFFFFFPL